MRILYHMFMGALSILAELIQTSNMQLQGLLAIAWHNIIIVATNNTCKFYDYILHDAIKPGTMLPITMQCTEGFVL